MIIMGIDPGIAKTGYGIIKYAPNKLTVLDYGCIRTLKTDNLAERLLIIGQEIERLIKEYGVLEVVLEEVFFNKNVKTALGVGQARGAVILAAVQQADCTVNEYTPIQVKQAVTGYGRATKEQVQTMVTYILHLSSPPSPFDVSDALAVAICHAHSVSWQVRRREATY